MVMIDVTLSGVEGPRESNHLFTSHLQGGLFTILFKNLFKLKSSVVFEVLLSSRRMRDRGVPIQEDRFFHQERHDPSFFGMTKTG